MLANNETGVTEPPAEVDGRWPHRRGAGGWLLLDAVQAAGKIAVRLRRRWARTPSSCRRTSSAGRRAWARCVVRGRA